MKQLIQSVDSGELAVIDVPRPQVLAGGILVRTHASLVSAGTERTMATFAQQNLLEKARSRPDLVAQTLEKVRRDGILDTINAVRSRLDQPMALGYSAAGEVIEVGRDVTEFRVGDRVACAGGGFAVHAQLISVPRNLAAPIPDTVSYEQAAFSTLGAIALHGIRLANVRLGEVVAVIGLGLLGQLTVQMLRAAGCTVIGTDIAADRTELALRLGAHWAGTDVSTFKAQLEMATGGHGADAVLITADTPSDQPVELAGEVSRKRGTVISVGAVGTRLPRKLYFEKELEFRVSRSYGPGRYDAEYENKGHDYPYEFVRWTEKRNLASFASMIASGAVDVEALITHRFEIENAPAAYALIMGRSSERFLGVLLRYSNEPDLSRRLPVENRRAESRPSGAAGSQPVESINVGVLGAGLFATGTLLPVMKSTANVSLIGISSGGGVSARKAADRFGFAYCATDSEALLRDERVNTVAILTRHSSHARQVVGALRAGKNVFVEKPLCLTNEELETIVATRNAMSPGPMVMVGYNRRFAPFAVMLRETLRRTGAPLMLTYRVNAGFIDAQHWTQDPEQGGGRLRGEGCHFIDLLIDLAGDRVRHVTTRALPDAGKYREDNFTVTMEFERGSIGTVFYAANGAKAFGKEAIEAFGGGIAARIDDYRSLHIQEGGKSRRDSARLRQDKGHRGEWEAIARHLTSGAPAPVPFEELVHSTRVTLAAYESLRNGTTVEVA
ncbi:MAG TPA: bi-domain-containing oxidoreductase [Thermoanaerobaculia bacterium]|nr:bi-domain-containing oxidoreductase [Thermoanaerobaculia bacterium]